MRRTKTRGLAGDARRHVKDPPTTATTLACLVPPHTQVNHKHAAHHRHHKPHRCEQIPRQTMQEKVQRAESTCPHLSEELVHKLGGDGTVVPQEEAPHRSGHLVQGLRGLPVGALYNTWFKNKGQHKASSQPYPPPPIDCTHRRIGRATRPSLITILECMVT